jgi:integrase
MENIVLFPEIRQDRTFEVIDGLDVSEETRLDYKARIKNFLVFVEKVKMDHDTFLKYKRELAHRIDLSAASKNKYLTTARIYLRELSRKGILTTDITLNVKQFKMGRKHKKFGFTKEEAEKVIEFLKYCSDRDKCVIFVLYTQGLRTVELLRIRIEDIDFEHSTLKIQGKGCDDKVLTNIHPVTLKVIKDYAGLRKEGLLFDITDRTVRNINMRICKHLKIKGTVHGWRHLFTTILIKAYNGNLIEVSKYTRHRSLETLQIYNDELETKENLPTYIEAFAIKN